MAAREGFLYVSSKGGYHSRIARFDLATGERTVIVDGLPDGGWHEPGGPVFGPDGLLYFAQGSVSQNGVILPQGYIPRAPYPYLTSTGPFKPLGVKARKGEVVKGELKCSSGVWRAQPDGSEMELLAWGMRNPYGMAFGEDGPPSGVRSRPA